MTMADRDPPVRFGVLGSLDVVIGDCSVKLGANKQRAVLGTLLLRPNRVVSVDQLIESVWGREGVGSASTLHVNVSKLRRELGAHALAELVVTRPPGYLIEISERELDLLEFEAEVNAARTAVANGKHALAGESYQRALALWRGDVLADLPRFGLIEDEARHWELEREAAQSAQLESEAVVNAPDVMIPRLRRAVDTDPYNERLVGLLMRVLYRAGRATEALSEFRALQHRLGEELGLRPSPELQQLETQVLSHDRNLSADAAQLRDTVSGEPAELGPSTAHLTIDDRAVGLDRAVTTIGRNHDRTIVLDGERVSRRHAEIRRGTTRFTLVDVGSTNGTRVNGELVTSSDLNDGDIIEIGDTNLTFRAS